MFRMANREHAAKIKKGVKAWNAWRSAHASVKPDLSGIDCIRWGPSYPYYYQDLPDAPFRNANFEDTDFSHAVLRDANLRGANLTRAHLDCADLGLAHLQGAFIASASLRETSFSGARFGGTILSNLDFRNVKGLASVTHDGPSTIGIDTILSSRGQIPEVFLRGCGVPEQFIAYARSLVADAIEFHSCFISYSSQDQDFAERLHADLQNKGVRCWFAPHNIAGGKKIHHQIDEAIRIYDRLLLILSVHSMKSRWVKTEISNARKKETTQGRQVLFPVRLVDYDAIRPWKLFDADAGDDSAAELREYFIPDFSNWKDHDSYNEAVERLVRDLKSKQGAAAQNALFA